MVLPLVCIDPLRRPDQGRKWGRREKSVLISFGGAVIAVAPSRGRRRDDTGATVAIYCRPSRARRWEEKSSCSAGARVGYWARSPVRPAWPRGDFCYLARDYCL